MNKFNFKTRLTSTDSNNNFKIRRTLERLREGLFDPLGVQLLTTGGEKLNQILNDSAKKLDHGQSCHLCICGAYGQGKSHALNYLKHQAVDQNLVVSYINLDPVQVCFHHFNVVYQSLMENLCFPDTKDSFIQVWKNRSEKWLTLPENKDKTLQDLIPETIPHKFQCILTAMAQKTMEVPPKKRKLKKHARFKPGSFSWVLKNALLGRNIPAWRLNTVFKYRQVDFYKNKSLVCKKPHEYLDMVQGMGILFKNIGYKGWMLLFDEGESIAQNNIICRSKSYRLLDKIFYPEVKKNNLFSVLAFTNDFFSRLEYETYDRTKPRKKHKTNENKHNGSLDNQIFYFDKNYHDDWKNIQKLRLYDILPKEWEVLIHRIVILHGIAYKWKPSLNLMQTKISRELSNYKTAETRLKFKITINILDIEQQKLQFS